MYYMVSKMFSVIFDVYLDKIILAFLGSLPRQCKLRAMKNRRMTLRSMDKYPIYDRLSLMIVLPPFIVLFFLIFIPLSEILPEKYVLKMYWLLAIVCLGYGMFVENKVSDSLNDSFFEKCSIKDTKWHIKWGFITFLYTISFILFILKLNVIDTFFRSLLHKQ